MQYKATLASDSLFKADEDRKKMHAAAGEVFTRLYGAHKPLLPARVDAREWLTTMRDDPERFRRQP